MTTVEVTAPPAVPANRIFAEAERPGLAEKLVVPGGTVSSTGGFMRGHGTYSRGADLVASLAGTVQQVNRLVSVKPIKTRYSGEIGDVVIGRVVDVQQKRWKLDTNSRLFSNLPLSSINLPGGEVRRKSVEDELMMREYLKEGDLISAEVQQIHHDGVLSLHTRNLKYGKLAQGILVKVPAYLVKRRKTHFHPLPCGAAVIIGCNGFIWVCPELSEDPDGGYNQNLEEVIPTETRRIMSRIATSVRLLADHCVNIHEATIIAVFECSLPFETKELLKPDVAAQVVTQAVQKVQLESEQ